MKKLLFLLFALISIESFAQSFIPNTPTLDLKSYILIEPNTNTVIASFNEDAPIEPASMTKVMSSYVVADQIANDFLSCLLYTSPSPRDMRRSRMPSSA